MSILLEKKLGFGTMRLPLLDAEDPKSIDLETFQQMADLYLERGFCYFDTAYPYHEGLSEEAVRRCVAERYPRDRFLLADKMPVYLVKQPEDYERIFAEQLRRCGVEYFDVYLLHNLGRDRYPNTERLGGFAFLRKLKEQGLARNIGFSFHDDAETLDRILTEHPEVDAVQLQINYLDWNGAVAQSGRCYETAKRHGKDVIVMEPVKGGQLAALPGKAKELFSAFYGDTAPSPASLAIRFAASLSQVKVVLSGMSSLEQMEDNLKTFTDFRPLDEKEMELIHRAQAALDADKSIPCTACHYCTKGCPMEIPIPEIFNVINRRKGSPEFRTIREYGIVTAGRGTAGDCVSCGQCERACPQGLPIIKLLRQCRAELEK